MYVIVSIRMLLYVLRNDLSFAHIWRSCAEWTVMGVEESRKDKLVIFDPAWISEYSGDVFLELILRNQPIYKERVGIADNNYIRSFGFDFLK